MRHVLITSILVLAILYGFDLYKNDGRYFGELRNMITKVARGY
jgi:hypothetical protein